METNSLIIRIKDKSKMTFLIQLLEQLGFDDIDIKSGSKKTTVKHDFFKSAGIWKDKAINAQELRKLAWNRKR